MMDKYRVHEVAKDLNVPSKEVADLLTQNTDSPKKHMTALTEEELDIVFDHYTKQKEVRSFETYFKLGEKARPQQAAAPKGEEKPAGEGRPAQQGQRPQGQRPQGNSQQPRGGQQRPQGDRGPRPQGGSQPRQQQGRPAPRPAAPARPAPDPSKRTDDGTGVRHVDMRASHVDLDKYNERYEQIAPTNLVAQKDTGVKKQKINQRSAQRGKPVLSRKQKEEEKLRRLELERQRRQKLEITIPDEITVGDLALRLKVTAAEIVKRLMGVGVMASVSQVIDYDTAALVAMEIGAKVEKEVVVTIEDRLFVEEEDSEENLQPRCPIVVVMGHVDHGKTSLLDYIRNAHVAAGEAGGITQHIGAYQVNVQGKTITFLDTPGHEAFTAMRARGAMITDVAILVVAADDGIMPQTVESINHAKAANIPIIVAINKMDKPEANPERIKEQLTKYELVPEEWGGETIICPISAKTGEGIDNLLEMVNLTAEMQELKANPNRSAHGAVIEARLDKGRGPVATLLVQNGTLKQGDVIIAGTAVGRVRAMTSAKGEKLTEAGPSVPVEIIGMGEVPGAGDDFHAVADERMARELVEQRKHEQKMAASAPVGKVSLEDLFSQIKQGEMKDLNIIVKADVQGSAEAVKASLEKLSNEEVRVRVIHCAVGAISESDVMLATTSNAIIVGFNVRPDNNAKESAARNNVDMRMYRVIYDCINEIETAMKGMLAPKFKEVELGQAEVRNVFRITGVGMVAGCYVTGGKMQRGAQMRLLRDNIVIYDGAIASLQRFKDSVKEVAQGYECGITFEKFQDIKEGDVIEAYLMEQIEV